MNPCKLSIVIISMNNHKDVISCVQSIQKFNDIHSFQILLIAYKYTSDNLEVVKSNFPFLEIIQTDGIKGFSENNNIAFKHVKGNFCLFLNDDTFFVDDSITKMLIRISTSNLKSIVYPVILNLDNTIQFLGRPIFNIFSFMLNELKIQRKQRSEKIIDDLLETHNISGACFMIESNTFRELGCFDEKYFFCPEDIALSTKLKNSGGKIFVDLNSKVYHNSSTTAKKIHQITIPVSRQGAYFFLREFYGSFQEHSYRLFVFFISILKIIFWFFNVIDFNRRKIMLLAMRNNVKYAFSNKMPKDIFIELSQPFTNRH